MSLEGPEGARAAARRFGHDVGGILAFLPRRRKGRRGHSMQVQLRQNAETRGEAGAWQLWRTAPAHSAWIRRCQSRPLRSQHPADTTRCAHESTRVKLTYSLPQQGRRFDALQRCRRAFSRLRSRTRQRRRPKRVKEFGLSYLLSDSLDSTARRLVVRDPCRRECAVRFRRRHQSHGRLLARPRSRLW